MTYPADEFVRQVCYGSAMSDLAYLPDGPQLRSLEADHLQEIEGNPLSADERDMFAMFEREGWSIEKQRAYVLERLETARTVRAAE
jgi:hypothetical protein